MTEKTCAVPTPEQRKYFEIREAAERVMLAKVFQAIEDAADEVADGFRKANLEFEPTSSDYLIFTIQQVAFVRLCGADPDTLRGSNSVINLGSSVSKGECDQMQPVDGCSSAGYLTSY